MAVPVASNSLYDFGPVADDYERWYDTPEGRGNDRVQQRDVRTLLPPADHGEFEPRVVTIPPADACHLDGPFLIARVQLP